MSDQDQSDEGQQAQRLREDWTGRIDEAAGNPSALHDVAVAWSDTARQASASLLDSTRGKLRPRDDMLERLRQGKRAASPLVKAAIRRGLNVLFQPREALRAADVELKGSHRRAYEIFERARQASLQAAGEWPAHRERWEAQGPTSWFVSGGRPAVSEASEALRSAPRSLFEALETLSQPVPDELRPE